MNSTPCTDDALLQVVKAAEEAVSDALMHLQVANAKHRRAVKRLVKATIDYARANPHPWMGMNVYRIQKAEGLKRRYETGVVCFKDFDTPDYENPHIGVGKYFVLVGGKSAHWLDENNWHIEI